MFPVSVPNKSDIFKRCRQQYGVVPRPDWEENHFWGPNIGAGSNIFLSAGQVDPWRAAGIPLVRRHSTRALQTPRGSQIFFILTCAQY